jgi:hypothetical protein
MNRLTDLDSADRALFLKLYIRLLLIGGPLLLVIIGGAVAKGWIPPWLGVILAILDPGMIYLLARGLFWLMDRGAIGFANMVYAGGGHPLAPPHSAIESLEVRGFYVEAADGWRQHLLQFPGDNQARFKLATLCHRQLGRADEAEGVLLEVRRSNPTDAEERQASNLLIDLFHATGQRDREIVELARFADRWKGTVAAADASRRLRELKSEPWPDLTGSRGVAEPRSGQDNSSK